MKTTPLNSTGYYDNYEPRETQGMFDPLEYITLQDDGYAVCANPMADGGLSAITVNTKLMGEGLRNFEASVKRMVLAKLFSPKFAEVILTATRIQAAH